MLHLTAVTSKEKDNDRNNSQETGIFVTHSPTKKSCSKNNYNNILMNNCTRTLLTICYVSSLLGFTPAAVATQNFDVFKPPPAPFECGSIDLRNDCDNFHILNNCTAITGFLDITFIPRPDAICDFNEYHFDNLREITDFLIINEVKNLTSIKNLFPNLSVIRGQRLFINHALLITAVADLEKVEFKSLIAIPRGHVLIDDTPKLCYTEKINWTRLTLRPGTNNIFFDGKPQCPEEAKCSGCRRGSCWSNDVCQKLENDSVLSLTQDIMECHEQCLGGCYNDTAQGCVVCRSYTDHGTCVKKCPSDKYSSDHYLRCYTREECLEKRLYIHNTSCVDYCPVGYESNKTTGECYSCGGCTRTCSSKSPIDNIIYLPDIMHAEFLRGCQILNATVMVNIRQFIDYQELVDNLKDVKEITGYLKINKSPYLTSLNFFKNLEVIHGNMLENHLYALVVYNNHNLTKLWDVKPGFRILNGGMYIQANSKLCNRRIREFRENVKHDNSLDSYQKSDQDILCSPAKLNLFVEVLNHRSIKLHWPKDQTLDEVEIIYKPMFGKGQISEKSEIETDVCSRINWRRELIFRDELQENSTNYIYVVKNLQPHTRYACLVKTFNGDDDMQEARSEIKYATTQFDIPAPPKISIKSKTDSALNIEFSVNDANAVDSQVVDFYLLEVLDIPDDKVTLDTRDYCDVPAMNHRDFDEDYDDCCSRLAKDRQDQDFLSQLEKDFACSLDQMSYCKPSKEFSDTSERKPILVKRFEAWENNFTLLSLDPFHLYVLQIKACNHAGCSTYKMLSTRTNFSTASDKLRDFSVCKRNKTNEYRVYFPEPPSGNGYITSYSLHFRHGIKDEDSEIPHRSEVVCVTRLEHERNKNLYVQRFNYTFDSAAVRVHSLGYNTFMEWVNITACEEASSSTVYTSWIVFLVVLLLGAVGFSVWALYERGYLTQLRRYLPVFIFVNDDRNILVEGFDAVRFQNVPDEDRYDL